MTAGRAEPPRGGASGRGGAQAGDRSAAILLADLVGVDLPTAYVDEPLAAVLETGRLAVDRGRQRIASRSPYFAHARLGVIERLRSASEALPAGYGLLLFEGYRPPAGQRASFERALSAARAERPELSAAEAERLASEYVAPPSLAGHPSGGAVDVTLTLDGVELDMGTAFNDEPGQTGGRTYTGCPLVVGKARLHRSLLARAMEGAGFVNYPPEWWHWSYGDPYWAFASGGAIRYAQAEEPSP